MGEGKHTPGPWTLHSWGEIQSDDPEFRFVAQAVAINGNYETAKANARLIAAAPELLEVLQRVAELDECEAHIEDAYERLLPQIRAAILKATNPLRS